MTGINVFADLGFRDAEMQDLKAKLARRIGELIAENGLTQVEAAARIGLSQPDVSKMLRGQFRSLSLERLLRCLAALGQSVTLEVGQAPQRSRAGEPDDPVLIMGAHMTDIDPLDLLATIREGLLVLEPDLTVRFANRSFCKTFGTGV